MLLLISQVAFSLTQEHANVAVLETILKLLGLLLGMSLPFLLPLTLDQSTLKHVSDYKILGPLPIDEPRRIKDFEIVLKWRDLLITSAIGDFAIILAAGEKVESSSALTKGLAIIAIITAALFLIVTPFIADKMRPQDIQATGYRQGSPTGQHQTAQGHEPKPSERPFIIRYVFLVGIPYSLAALLTILA